MAARFHWPNHLPVRTKRGEFVRFSMRRGTLRRLLRFFSRKGTFSVSPTDQTKGGHYDPQCSSSFGHYARRGRFRFVSPSFRCVRGPVHEASAYAKRARARREPCIRINRGRALAQ